MRPMLRALTLLVLPAIAFAQDDAKKAPEGDLGKLQGEWKGMIGPEKNVPIFLTIKDKAVNARIVAPDGQEFTLQGEILVDEKASPKTVDWLNFKTPAGEDAQTNKGIYKIEGEKWVVCNGGPGNPRPTEFKPGEEGPPSLIEFERVKK